MKNSTTGNNIMTTETKRTLCGALVYGAIVATFIGIGVANAATDMPFVNSNSQTVMADTRGAGNGTGLMTGEGDFTMDVSFEADGSGGADAGVKNGWSGYTNGHSNTKAIYVNDDADAGASGNGMGNGTATGNGNGNGSAQGKAKMVFSMSFKARGNADMKGMGDMVGATSNK